MKQSINLIITLTVCIFFASCAQAESSDDTEEEADKVARAMAQKDNVELVIHNKDGGISDKDSFGNDPCPPKDTVF